MSGEGYSGKRSRPDRALGPRSFKMVDLEATSSWKIDGDEQLDKLESTFDDRELEQFEEVFEGRERGRTGRTEKTVGPGRVGASRNFASLEEIDGDIGGGRQNRERGAAGTRRSSAESQRYDGAGRRRNSGESQGNEGETRRRSPVEAQGYEGETRRRSTGESQGYEGEARRRSPGESQRSEGETRRRGSGESQGNEGERRRRSPGETRGYEGEARRRSSGVYQGYEGEVRRRSTGVSRGYGEPRSSRSAAGHSGAGERVRTVNTVRRDGPGRPYTGNRRPVNRRRRKKRWPLVLIPVFLILMAGAVYFVLTNFCVKGEMTAEVGDKCPEIAEFLNWRSSGAQFVSDIGEETIFDSLGDYNVVIRAYGKDSTCVVHVRDTVAPAVTTQNVTSFVGGSVGPEEFIAEIADKTETTVRFQETPDFSTDGNHRVVLEVTDEGGNVTRAEAVLEVVRDTEPPVISGVAEITMTAGASVSYKKGITVTDNVDSEPEFTVDTSAVDTSKPGDYTVVYRAADAAGNEATASTILHVKPVTLETVTEEIINGKADELLATLLTDNMTQYEQAKAIYWWCHDNIAYSDHTPKTDWIQGAYRGIVDRKGDCFTYASTAKCLLTRAGITNMDIEKIWKEGISHHYWNIIDIGEGWHHFDTCRRKDGSTFFYKTDAELMEYSDSHKGSHNYDRSLYPEIP